MTNIFYKENQDCYNACDIRNSCYKISHNCNNIMSYLVYFKYMLKLCMRGFPGGTVVKNPPANAGGTGSSPGLGRSHMPRSN